MTDEPDETEGDADDTSIDTAAEEEQPTSPGEGDASEADEAEAPAESSAADGLQPGDVVRIDFTAYSVESEQLVDTTDPDVAEEEGIDDEDQTFEPRIIVLGEGHVFDPLDEAIIGGEPGDSGTVVVPAAEAFGEVDPDDVRTISADKIPEDDRYPGAHVDIEGQHGFVETIVGGRARVDFNHPLAGEDIEYEYEILEEVEDREALAKGLIEAFLDLELEVWFDEDEIEPDEEATDADDDEAPEPESVESLYIEATPELTMNQQWLFMKQQVADQLIDHVDVDRVVVQEIVEHSQAQFGGMESMLPDDVDAEEALADVEGLDELEE